MILNSKTESGLKSRIDDNEGIAGAHPHKEAGIARFFKDVFHTVPASHTMHDQGSCDHFTTPHKTFCSDRAYSSPCPLLGTFPIRMPSVIFPGRAYSSQLLVSHEAIPKSRHPNIMATESLQLGTKEPCWRGLKSYSLVTSY